MTDSENKYTVEAMADKTVDQMHELYSQMLATAHDLGYEVPDELLIETDSADELRTAVAALHVNITAHREKEPLKPVAEPEKKAVKSRAKKTAAAQPPETQELPQVKEPPVKPVEPKKASRPKAEKEKTDMAKAAKAPAAPKTAKKAAAKAPVAKKAVAKKAAKENAREPVARTKHSEKATIKVLTKDKANPTRKGTGRYDRVQNLIKHDGKLVSDFLGKGGGATGTLKFAAEAGWIKIVG